MFDDLDDLCDTINSLEGKAAAKGLEGKATCSTTSTTPCANAHVMLDDLDDLSDSAGSQGKAPRASSKGSASAKAEKAEFTLEKALQLQAELLVHFKEPAFQSKLAELNRQFGKAYEGLNLGGEEERHRLFHSVHEKVLPKYGFEGSHEGTLEMLAQASRHNGNAEFERQRRQLYQLLGMQPTEEELKQERQAVSVPAGLPGKGSGKGLSGLQKGLDRIQERLSLLPERSAAVRMPPVPAVGGEGTLEAILLEQRRLLDRVKALEAERRAADTHPASFTPAMGNPEEDM